uniref:taste receptor type 2 member 8-like n=1 Tax=Euleptes europaea TaxID=460621 RepID=UPI00254263A7|nr:taste receptor type 2 member 8-like [Euleptes europaea]
MTGPLAVVLLLILAAEVLVGITTNAFIVAVNLLSWAKGVVLSPTDQVLLSLGVSNLLVQGTSTTAGLSFFYKKLLYEGSGLHALYFFSTFSTLISIWLTSLLFTSYHLMMNRTLHPLFLRMKRLFIENMFWTLSCIFLVAFVFGLLTSGCPAPDVPQGAAANLTSNSSKPFLHFCHSVPFRLTLAALLCICPSLTTTFCVVQILTDIWKHVWNIKKTMAGTGEPSLKAHRSASGTLTALLVLYLFYTLTGTLSFFNIFPNSSIWILVCTTIFSISTSAQAVTFILGIPRLKKEALRILQRFRSSRADEHGKSVDAISYVTPP